MRTRQWLLGGWVVLALGFMGRPGSCWRAGGCAPPAAVRSGLEVLLEDSLHLLQGRRVALVTNQAGVDGTGRHGADRLRAAGVMLVALFSPEHGFRGTADPGAPVASTIDSATGLPIYSLYGRNWAPTDSQLTGVDLLLVDLQDVGARYFTYLRTTVEVMRAAERHHLPVLVLDRPNPIGGAVQGNVLDTTYRSSVGLLAMPMRHGMTLGELSLMARHDLGLGADLRVVPAAGWRRAMYFDQTGLPFVPPSPNLRSLEALLHYPGLCLFEGTTLSVGRGTEHAFEQVGAPWVDTTRLLAGLRAAALPGVAYAAVAFTPVRPGDGKYADTLVVGVRLRVTDRDRYDPPRTAVLLLRLLGEQVGPGLFPRPAPHFDRLVGDGGRAREALLFPGPAAGQLQARLLADWNSEARAFEARRRPYLLYPE